MEVVRETDGFRLHSFLRSVAISPAIGNRFSCGMWGRFLGSSRRIHLNPGQGSNNMALKTAKTISRSRQISLAHRLTRRRHRSCLAALAAMRALPECRLARIGRLGQPLSGHLQENLGQRRRESPCKSARNLSRWFSAASRRLSAIATLIARRIGRSLRPAEK